MKTFVCDYHLNDPTTSLHHQIQVFCVHARILALGYKNAFSVLILWKQVNLIEENVLGQISSVYYQIKYYLIYIQIIQHWCAVGTGKSQHDGPPFQWETRLSRVSHSNEVPEGWDFHHKLVLFLFLSNFIYIGVSLCFTFGDVQT